MKQLYRKVAPSIAHPGPHPPDGSGTGARRRCLCRLRRPSSPDRRRCPEDLEYVPGRFIVNRIARPRLTCTCCERFVQAPLPSRPIERGRPGPGLLAHVPPPGDASIACRASGQQACRSSAALPPEPDSQPRRARPGSRDTGWLGRQVDSPSGTLGGCHPLPGSACLHAREGVAMSSAPRRSSHTLRLSACRRPAPAKHEPRGFGPMPATNDPGAGMHQGARHRLHCIRVMLRKKSRKRSGAHTTVVWMICKAIRRA